MRGLIHLIIAILLSIIFLPIGFIYSVGKKLFDVINSYTYSIAYNINRLANIVCQDLFNDTLIKKKYIKRFLFGADGKSISYCIGKNLLYGSLSKTGIILNKLLNWIEKEHTIKEVQKEDNV